MIRIGKIVSTHGIKGEVKILSDFEFKDKVFVVGNILYVDDCPYIIKSYRHHKNFEMVTLNDYKDINDILFLMKKDVYFDEADLSLEEDEIMDSEYLEYTCIDQDGNKGEITEVFYASSTNKILRVMFDKEVLIPISSPMYKGIDKNKKEVYVEVIKGM